MVDERAGLVGVQVEGRVGAADSSTARARRARSGRKRVADEAKPDADEQKADHEKRRGDHEIPTNESSWRRNPNHVYSIVVGSMVTVMSAGFMGGPIATGVPGLDPAMWSVILAVTSRA